jgi:hypothetical protein
MAKYTLSHSCGHSVDVDLRPSDVAYKTHKIESSKCIACERLEKSACATQAAKDQGLPVLVGTEKQIAYAEVIRQRIIPELKSSLAEYEDASAEQRAAVLGHICSKTDAAYWIAMGAPDDAIAAAAIELGLEQ